MVSETQKPPPSKEGGYRLLDNTGQRLRPLQALWQIVTLIDRSKINLAQALRNTLGVVAPLIVGHMMGMPRGGLAMSSGALNVSYSDGSDPYQQRAKRMLASTLWCSIAVLLGGLTAHNNVASVLVATAWAFIAGMLVALGTSAADVGVISTVVLVVYAAQPLTPRQALEAAGLALCGGLLQILLSVALWPVRRYEPERRSLGALYSELARIATHPSEATEVAERVLTRLQAPINVGEPVTVGASIGIAFNTNMNETGEELIRDADQAMYRAKAQGKNRYVLCHPSQDVPASDQIQRWKRMMQLKWY